MEDGQGSVAVTSPLMAGVGNKTGLGTPLRLSLSSCS